ncbi:MAG: tol-pal system protein YbgF [Candidatus Eiseniibacteriota bacterium]
MPEPSTTTTDIAMLPRPFSRLRAGPVLMIAAALALTALPALAQNALPMTPRNALPATPQDVEARALKEQVQELGQKIADARVLLAETVRNQVPPTVAAQLEVRLSDLEAEVRGLTGRIEELDFGMRRMNERLDKAMADMEFRISELEEGKGGKKGAKTTAKNAKSAEAKSAEAKSTDNKADGARGEEPASSGTEHPGGGPAASQPQTAMANPGPVKLPQGSETDQYQYAMSFLRKGQYEQASSALQAFVAAHPNGQLASNAVYWLGESFYARGMFDQAAVRFAEGYQKYPNGAKGPDSLLKLGMSLGRLNKKTEACTTLAELRRKYPDAPGNIQSGANAARQRFGCR